MDSNSVKTKSTMKIEIKLFLMIFAISLSCDSYGPVFWPADKAPDLVAHKITMDLLSRPEFMMYSIPGVSAVHYSEVCTAYGAARIAGLAGDEEIITRLAERYGRVISDSIPNTANHVDANVFGILPLELYRLTGEPVFYRQGMELADGQWMDTVAGGLTSQVRFWIDDLYMIGSLQVEAYRVTGKKVYIDRAAETAVSYLERLQQPNGLFFHGENAPFFWGRGNGWMAAGLTEVISALPGDHMHYSRILEGYQRMMEALLVYRAEDGMWRQVVDVDTSWKETSCTGMFGYAMASGVKNDILKGRRYRKAYQKAWLALTSYINENGRVTDVCVGTGQSREIRYYLDRPSVTGDFQGQAPVLWMAYELMKDQI